MVYRVNVLRKSMKNYSVNRIAIKTEKTIDRSNFELISLDWYETIRTNDPPIQKREVPAEYKTEIQALEQCCQHRTHCLIYNIAGFIKVENKMQSNKINESLFRRVYFSAK